MQTWVYSLTNTYGRLAVRVFYWVNFSVGYLTACGCNSQRRRWPQVAAQFKWKAVFLIPKTIRSE